jgi:hypothetical protein
VSIFVRFDGKSYKLPDALTLGRGEPFDVVDRTLARAHARLVFRNEKWKIKDLSSDCGIMVNGQRIKSGKYHQVYPHDKITLGNVPLEIYESLPENSYVEVKNFTAVHITDFAPYIYGGLVVLGLIVAFTESKGDLIEDVLFLGVIAAFLKLASVVTRALRTIYFPVSVVIESNLTSEGATFHITGAKNFSLKFKDISKWYIIGKCFFINVYDRKPIFVMHEGHEELANLLREHCPKKRAMGEPILEKMALLPALFVVTAWICLLFADTRFFHFMGHGFGILGLGGLLALFFSEHLRELLPFPEGFSPWKQTFGLAGLIAITLVMQFAQFQSHYKTNTLVKALYTCSQDKSCQSVDFAHLTLKKLPKDELGLLQRICSEGNQTACEGAGARRPASQQRKKAP